VSRGAESVKEAFIDAPFRFAESTTDVSAATGRVVTTKAILREPAGINTVAGGFAAETFEERAIVSPPEGAALPIVRVPVTLPPPFTLAGVTVNPVIFGASTVTFVAILVAPVVPVTVATVFVPTGRVVVVNDPDVLPFATVTEAGTGAAAVVDANVTVSPALGAGPVRLNVAVA